MQRWVCFSLSRLCGLTGAPLQLTFACLVAWLQMALTQNTKIIDDVMIGVTIRKVRIIPLLLPSVSSPSLVALPLNLCSFRASAEHGRAWADSGAGDAETRCAADGAQIHL